MLLVYGYSVICKAYALKVMIMIICTYLHESVIYVQGVYDNKEKQNVSIYKVIHIYVAMYVCTLQT